MRLTVARCEVIYTGRLSARLPESTRLMLKSDGSVLVHAAAGGYKPLNLLATLFPTGRRLAAACAGITTAWGDQKQDDSDTS